MIDYPSPTLSVVADLFQNVASHSNERTFQNDDFAIGVTLPMRCFAPR
jgi:hypothetical protein